MVKNRQEAITPVQLFVSVSCYLLFWDKYCLASLISKQNKSFVAKRRYVLKCNKNMSFSIYQHIRYPFVRALICSRNSSYPRLLVDFEEEVKMTESTRA